jgi:hypothetical protein
VKIVSLSIWGEIGMLAGNPSGLRPNMFFTFCKSAMPLELKKVNAPGSKRICGGRSLMRTDALVTRVGGDVRAGVAPKRGLFCVLGCCVGV